MPSLSLSATPFVQGHCFASASEYSTFIAVRFFPTFNIFITTVVSRLRVAVGGFQGQHCFLSAELPRSLKNMAYEAFMEYGCNIQKVVTVQLCRYRTIYGYTVTINCWQR